MTRCGGVADAFFFGCCGFEAFDLGHHFDQGDGEPCHCRIVQRARARAGAARVHFGVFLFHPLLGFFPRWVGFFFFFFFFFFYEKLRYGWAGGVRRSCMRLCLITRIL